jgi:hypothetical protein
MENNDLACASREVAIAALETLASIMPMGTQHDALIAIRNWISENASRRLSDDTSKKLADFLKKTEGEQKGWDWYERGSTVVDGELVPTEPEDGAEWPCRYNAQAKQWDPKSKPPIVLKKTVTSDEE